MEDKSEDGSTILDELGWSSHLFATGKQLWLCNAMFDYKEICRLVNNLFGVALAKMDCQAAWLLMASHLS